MMKLDWLHFSLSHLTWIVAILVALVLGHSWLAEHDARMKADATIKASEATVATLQQQIAATNAQAAQKVQTIVKIVRETTTPTQAVAAIPQLTDIPLNGRVSIDNGNQVSVDAIPLIQVLGQAKENAVQLGACQSDLKNETAIGAQKDVQIAALKKKPSLLHRVGHVLKLVGIGVSIGAFIGAHGL